MITIVGLSGTLGAAAIAGVLIATTSDHRLLAFVRAASDPSPPPMATRAPPACRRGGGDVMRRRILPVIYLVIGVVVAVNDGYLAHLTSAGALISALLAIVLWPVLLFGVHIAIP